MLTERLKELRSAQNLTQSAVADLLNITREAYSMYETGKRQLSYDSLCLLAEFYHVSTDYLLGRTMSKEPWVPLTKDETQLLKAYRHADKRGKDTIFAVVSFENEYMQKNKASRGSFGD